jgi:hypothetical protein
VFSIGDRVTDDVFKEVPKDTTDFFVDVSTDSLDSSTAGETPDCWLRNALNVLTHNLSMTFGTTLPKTFTTFASAGHCKMKRIISGYNQ